MKIRVVAVGKVRDKHFRALTKEYLGRLDHYLPTETVEVREGRGKSAEDVMAGEADALRDKAFGLGGGSITVAMDERGDEWTSEELAEWLEGLMVRGTRYVNFVIGGAHGMPQDLKDACDKRLALSRLTMPHEMARMLLVEQLYRAMTIIRGEPYHKA